ncbi:MULTISPECIES: DMT family transporter [unclassified Butyrivibrio]|uniref:DMT family transporter n=1 Tax=unclassified Butyrivibrio TaxID=2639466 RepID=UPI0003FC9A1B|nr:MULTISPECIES: DMT family transporter [unclassified Butyrivibrio]
MRQSERNTTKLISAGFLILASIVWGAAFVAQSLAGQSIGTYTFNGIRFIIGGFCLLPMIGHERKRGSLLQMSKLIGGIICGAALFLASTFQQAGIAAGAGSGEAGFITAFYIILVPILGIFLGKKNSKLVYIAVIVALVGLYYLCFPSFDALTQSGIALLSKADILLLGCAFMFSVQILCVDHYAPIMSPVALSCTQFFVAGALSCIFGFVFELLPNPATWALSLSTFRAWIPILYTGIFSSAIGYTLQAVGQRNLSPTIASLIMSMESVFATLFGWLILSQTLTAREILGCTLVFIAIILTQLKPHRIRKVSARFRP